MKCTHEFSDNCVMCLRNELAKARKTVELVADMATALAMPFRSDAVETTAAREDVPSDVILVAKHALAMASDTSTPADVLAALAQDAVDHRVRHGVARNTSTPGDVLAALAQDEDWHVRWYVARNTSTPADVLAALAQDEDEDVRWRVASNTSTPGDVLAALAQDESEYVRDVVRQRGRR